MAATKLLVVSWSVMVTGHVLLLLSSNIWIFYIGYQRAKDTETRQYKSKLKWRNTEESSKQTFNEWQEQNFAPGCRWDKLCNSFILYLGFNNMSLTFSLQCLHVSYENILREMPFMVCSLCHTTYVCTLIVKNAWTFLPLANLFNKPCYLKVGRYYK